MSTNETIFVCANCGESFLKWQGKCTNCGLWNTLKEMRSPRSRSPRGDRALPSEVVELSKINIQKFARLSTEIFEFDRVLGGGLIPGSIMILGGDPGIGKSTLLLQIAALLPNVLYISGEESVEQIKLRFDRLGTKASKIKLLTETNLDEICQKIIAEKPAVAIIDSIQTVYSDKIESTAGSIIQVRECAMRLQQLAKTNQTTVILVGHVTKDGTVAGPKTLEHLVDTVLYLEGERFHGFRILRSTKNRFGATDEIGIFEMSEKGLIAVPHPSKLLLEERLKNVAGSTVTATMEGSRAMLVEVQALTTPTVFGYPQRRASGFDLNRLQLLLAVLQKRAGLNIGGSDVFINIVGGIKIVEPAVDLAVILAVASSFKERIMPPGLCVFGEVGLSGEIRDTPNNLKRIAEAKRLGFRKFNEVKTISEAVRRYCV